mmetsp:Transcript_61099/g.132434  ORF Transcript_61099/g.132434 Transcript_61099/m.132434 type:complete len:333 (-) Transcript_61099:76-1074(-)
MRALTSEWDSEGESEASTLVEETQLRTVPPDIYGGCFIITLIATIKGQWGKLATMWMWVFINYLLQSLLIFTTHWYINRDKAVLWGIGDELTDRITRLESTLSNRTVLQDPDLIKLCQKQPNAFFFLVVIFLWSARMSGEAASCQALGYHILRTKSVRKMREMADFEGAGIIRGLLVSYKVLFTVTLLIPKILIAYALWSVGTEFLAFTLDMETLIMKSISLFFIVTIDDLLYANFIAPSKKEVVHQWKVQQDYGRAQLFWISWRGEICKLIVTLLLMLLSHNKYSTQSKLRSHCWDCVRDCSHPCSGAFDFCSSSRGISDEDWGFSVLVPW